MRILVNVRYRKLIYNKQRQDINRKFYSAWSKRENFTMLLTADDLIAMLKTI